MTGAYEAHAHDDVFGRGGGFGHRARCGAHGSQHTVHDTLRAYVGNGAILLNKKELRVLFCWCCPLLRDRPLPELLHALDRVLLGPDAR